MTQSSARLRPSRAYRFDHRGSGIRLRCSHMATVPQRELRNNTALLLRRVQRGERLTITVHGHAVADLVPVDSQRSFVAFAEIADGLRGLLPGDTGLDEELRDLMEADADDPFDRYEEVMRERRDTGAA